MPMKKGYPGIKAQVNMFGAKIGMQLNMATKPKKGDKKFKKMEQLYKL